MQSISANRRDFLNSEMKTLKTGVRHGLLHYTVTECSFWTKTRECTQSRTAKLHRRTVTCAKHGQLHRGRPHQPIRTRPRPLSRPQVLLLHFRPWLQSSFSQQVRPIVPQSTVLVTENVAAALFLSKFLPLAVFVTLRGLNLAAYGNKAGSQLCSERCQHL
jgi:hypothetical protein